MRPLRLALALCAVLVLAARAAAQDTPLVLEADRIVYDTRARRIEAVGNVRIRYRTVRIRSDYALADLDRQEVLIRGNVLLEQDGRRFAARMIRYDLRTERAVASDVRTVLDGIYYRAREVELRGSVVHALDALATVCDPAAPLFHVTAARVTVIPGQRLVAEGAELRVAGSRIQALGRVEVPLRERPAERFGEAFPRPEVGYDATSGLWGAVRYPYRLGDVAGEAYVRYNAILGFEGYNRLSHPTWPLQLTIGILRDSENRTYEATEVRYAPPSFRPFALPASASLTLVAGYYRERVTGAEGPRLEGAAGLVWDPIRVGPRARARLAASLRAALYRDRTLIVPATGLGLTYRLDDRSSLGVSYSRTDVWGRTPFLFDAPSRADVLSVGYAYTTQELGLGAGVVYDFVPQHLKVTGSLRAEIPPDWRFGVALTYNATTSSFEDVDLTLEKRCDCLGVSLTYRIVRQELFFGVTFTPSPAIPANVPSPPD